MSILCILLTLGCGEEKFAPINCTPTGPGWSYGDTFKAERAPIYLDGNSKFHLQTTKYSKLVPCGFLPEAFQRDDLHVLLNSH